MILNTYSEYKFTYSFIPYEKESSKSVFRLLVLLGFAALLTKLFLIRLSPALFVEFVITEGLILNPDEFKVFGPNVVDDEELKLNLLDCSGLNFCGTPTMQCVNVES